MRQNVSSKEGNTVVDETLLLFLKKGVVLTKKMEETQEVAESFQLIGVISKEMAPFPNPIEGADYI